MDSNTFKQLLDELDGNSLQTLKDKNGRYAQNGDCLHNFRSGAEIMGRTPAQTCWGYMTKHLTALRDKVEKDDFSDRDDFLEKCQDIINYIRFLWCIGNDIATDEIEYSIDQVTQTFKWGFDSEDEARKALDVLRVSLYKNNYASVADLYRHSNMQPYINAYNQIWYDLSEAKIYQGSHTTWVLELPMYKEKY